jgi:catechol 2,3-dioxygenase-like lactoylglutathione lyase family enzyme
MISSFHGVVVDLDAGDFESGVADYARLLGQAPGAIELEEIGQTRSVIFPLSNMRLEIRESTGSTEGDQAPGLGAIRLVCDDVSEIARRLEESALSSGPSPHRFLGPDEKRRIGGDAELELRTWISTRVDLAVSRSIGIELISEQEGVVRAEASDGTDRRGQDGSLIRGLDHVVVMSTDIEATRDFYADGLGLRLALDRSFEKRGVRLIFFRVGGVTIEIGGRLGAERNPEGRDRFAGLAWQVGEIDAIRSRLLGDRFDVSEIRDGNKPGTRVCTVRDPVHGVPTLLIEPVS